jgi:AcrR family transcriptional regulator
MEARGRILERAAQLFFGEGPARVTMDDVALACGMSKKTLYAHFKGKEELLSAVFAGLKDEMMARTESILDSGAPFFEKLSALMAVVGSAQLRLSPQFVADLQKVAPSVWGELEEYRSRGLVDRVSRLVAEGRAAGLIVEDLPEAFIVHACFTLVDSILKRETMLELSMSFQELFDHAIRLIFSGILTERGEKALKK